MDYQNPFEYKEATSLKDEDLIDYYIEDYNYSRFLRSRRNIYIKGERGCGKTMTLLFNSLEKQKIKAAKNKQNLNLDIICIYVPCKTSLHYKKEWELLDDFRGSVVSEHFFVVGIMDRILETISIIDDLLDSSMDIELRKRLEYLMDLKLPLKTSFVEGFRRLLSKISIRSQRVLNEKNLDSFYDNLLSFSSGVLPIISLLKIIPKLKNTHFAIMLDDVQDLNIHQQKALNSWIAYRDNTAFSFKLASTKVGSPTYVTSTGGTILEGHDFTTIDMEQPYQNKYSDFAMLANKIITRRLNIIGTSKTPEEFFPMNDQMKKDLDTAKNRVTDEAIRKYGTKNRKKINDYVYKYARAEYFKSRPSTSNIPPYSGFETLVHISTGVIRHLLEPCYWMYDMVISEMSEPEKSKAQVPFIPPSIQTATILKRSNEMWDFIKESLDKSIDNCSNDQATQVYNMFNQLAIYFKSRLHNHKSEPRAVTFTLSGFEENTFKELGALIKIARKAQILYTYTSSAKDFGQRETYYVPNRILWPARMLDPVGQHARASITAYNLWLSARDNKPIPFKGTEKDGLFND